MLFFLKVQFVILYALYLVILVFGQSQNLYQLKEFSFTNLSLITQFLSKLKLKFKSNNNTCKFLSDHFLYKFVLHNNISFQFKIQIYTIKLNGTQKLTINFGQTFLQINLPYQPNSFIKSLLNLNAYNMNVEAEVQINSDNINIY